MFARIDAISGARIYCHNVSVFGYNESMVHLFRGHIGGILATNVEAWIYVAMEPQCYRCDPPQVWCIGGGCLVRCYSLEGFASTCK